MPFYDKLLVNRGWDIAVIFVKDQQPMPIECRSCSVEVFENCLKLRMSVGPHPFDKAKTAASFFDTAVFYALCLCGWSTKTHRKWGRLMQIYYPVLFFVFVYVIA